MRKFIDIIESRLPLYPGQVPAMRGSYGAFIIVMAPMDFIRLTTHDQDEIDQIMDRPFPYSKDKYSEYMGRETDFGRYQMPFLKVGFPSGQIKGHEGRHRAAMVYREGGTSVPVTVYPYTDYRYFAKLTYWTLDDNADDVVRMEEFPDMASAEQRIAQLEADKKQNDYEYDADGLIFARGKVEIEGGYTLKGEPSRTTSPWEQAAWTVADFPKALIGQYNPTVHVSRYKVGLVKGYRHHVR